MYGAALLSARTATVGSGRLMIIENTPLRETVGSSL
jgi:hypothetical protein